MEQRKLVNTCTELSEGLVDDTKLTSLLEEPGGANWQDKSLQLSLRRRLGGSYQVFFDAVTEMTEIVEEFEDKLELDEHHMVSSMVDADSFLSLVVVRNWTSPLGLTRACLRDPPEAVGVKLILYLAVMARL